MIYIVNVLMYADQNGSDDGQKQFRGLHDARCKYIELERAIYTICNNRNLRIISAEAAQ